jgi:hypothetical protein
VLAFVLLDGMLAQLARTFGLAVACCAQRVNSLVAVIVLHTLWGMVQFLGAIHGPTSTASSGSASSPTRPSPRPCGGWRSAGSPALPLRQGR